MQSKIYLSNFDFGSRNLLFEAKSLQLVKFKLYLNIIQMFGFYCPIETDHNHSHNYCTT